VSALAVFIVAKVLPGITIDDYLSALMVAVVLAFLNTIVKPILTILSIPVTVLTLGFFLLVINAFIIILASKLVNGFRVDSFWWALFFSVLLSICTGILNMLFGVNEEE
jgi:putative membrane protein